MAHLILAHDLGRAGSKRLVARRGRDHAQTLQTSRTRPEDIAVVGFSCQMQGCLQVDAAGRPLQPCIIWADQRAVPQAEHLAQRLGEECVFQIIGHRITATLKGPKLVWVREHELEVLAQTGKFLHIKDCFACQMTGQFVTGHSDAGGMNLFDLDRGAWSEGILPAIELDQAIC